jgi:hypothetical protein
VTQRTLPGYADGGITDSDPIDGDFVWYSYRSRSVIEKRLAADGSLIQSINLVGKPGGVCFAKSGDYIRAFSPGVQGAWRVQRKTYSVGFINTVPAITSCSADDAGFIWITHATTSTLYKLDGTTGGILITKDLSAIASSKFYGVATSSTSVAVTGTDKKLILMSRQDLSVVRQVTLPNAFDFWTTMVYAGNYWFVCRIGVDNGTIYRYDDVSDSGFEISQQFQSIEAVAASPEGLWIANTHAYLGAYVYNVSYAGQIAKQINISTLYSITNYPRVYFAPNNILWINDYNSMLKIVPKP